MSTKTLPPKRAPEEQVIALMLIACRERELRWPEIVSLSESGHLQLNSRTSGEVYGWCKAVGCEVSTSVMRDGTVYYGGTNPDWNGWNVNIGLFEHHKAVVLDAETVELIGKATADDAAGSPEANDGSAGQCPSTWYGAPCLGEVAEGDVACDQHKTVPEFSRVAVMDPGFGCGHCDAFASVHIMRGDVVVGTACDACAGDIEAELLAGAAA